MRKQVEQRNVCARMMDTVLNDPFSLSLCLSLSLSLSFIFLYIYMGGVKGHCDCCSNTIRHVVAQDQKLTAPPSVSLSHLSQLPVRSAESDSEVLIP